MSAPDYSRNDQRGWCGDPKRGAAMGRLSDHSPGFAGQLHLRRVRLNQGGYDSHGTYFGTGSPLYWVASECGAVDFMMRCSGDRASARFCVLQDYPKARVRK